MNDRKAIRKKVASLLEDSIVFDGSAIPIGTSRVHAFRNSELPHIVVYGHDEPADHENTAPRVYNRVARIVVEGVLPLLAEHNLDDDLDDICTAIERRLFRYETLEGLVEDFRLIDSSTKIDPSGEVDNGGLRLVFEAEYQRDSINYEDAEEDGDLVSLDSANITIGINGTTKNSIDAQLTLSE